MGVCESRPFKYISHLRRPSQPVCVLAMSALINDATSSAVNIACGLHEIRECSLML